MIDDRFPRNYRRLFVLAMATLAISCLRAYDPDIERGAEYQYRIGYPEVRMTALGFLDEESEGVLNIAADIVEGSLIFRERDGQNVAESEIEIRIVGISGTRYSDTYTVSKTINSDYAGIIGSPETVQLRREMKVAPGNYEITISVVDKTSGRRTSRSTETFIPDPEEDIVNLTAVQLLGMHPGRERECYVPITTYHVSTVKNSLRFLAQVTNSRSDVPLVVVSQ